MALTPATKRLRILVVDDRRDSVLFLKTLLVRAGHDVMTAENGAGGLEVIREFYPDVVISDIGLDGTISAYVLANVVRNDPSIPDPHFIAVTGYDDDEHRRLAREAGFAYYLVKPAPIEELLSALSELPVRNKNGDA